MLATGSLRQRRAPRYRPLFIISGADVVTALPRAIRARKRKRLRGKRQSYRKGDTRNQHLHDCLPIFLACTIQQPCRSFCDRGHGMVFSLSFSDARTPLPAAMDCRGTREQQEVCFVVRDHNGQQLVE
jgi:hypothetical protein